MKMFNQGTSKPEASHSENIREENEENGDMAWACCEELVELDDVQLATVVGGVRLVGVDGNDIIPPPPPPPPPRDLFIPWWLIPKEP